MTISLISSIAVPLSAELHAAGSNCAGNDVIPANLTFNLAKFEKDFIWGITKTKSLTKQGEQKTATIELAETTPLADIFSQPNFASWSEKKKELIDSILAHWVNRGYTTWSGYTTVKFSMKNVYDGWLDNCVYPTLSNLVTSDEKPVASPRV